MKELQVIVNQKPAEISFNFDEIRNALSERMEVYKSIEVTEEILPERKEDIATLRKIAKAFDDKRKEVKNNYMLPYNAFEKKTKELIALVNEPIELINTQVKEFEEKKKAEKKHKALEYFNGRVGETDITFDEVFLSSWLLTATSFKSIKIDIDTAISNRTADIEAIKGMGSEVEEKALSTYKNTKRLSDAMKVINDYEKQKAEILAREEARRKAEEEQKRREEEARKAREEQRKLEEERARQAEIEREERAKQREIEAARQAEIERVRAEERAKIKTEMDALNKNEEAFPSHNAFEEVIENSFVEVENELPFSDIDVEPSTEPTSLRRTFKFTVNETADVIDFIKEFLTENEIEFEEE